MKYIIFGATGFLGELLTEKLSKEGHAVIAVARNEGKLISLKERFPGITIIPGDISDTWTVASAFLHKPDGVFLLSAFKHVGMAEKEVMQCVKSNVIGTLKVLKASMVAEPGFVILTSTDKAAQVAGVYGATKLLGERLFSEAQGLNADTKYRVVRYGNVLYSTGSVLCKWQEKMKNGEQILLTDPDATRFFWTRNEAVDLLFECLKQAPDTKPWMPEMKAMRMGDIMEAMMRKYGRVPVKVIGLQPGENKHETIDGVLFSDKAEMFTVEEIMELI